MIVVNREVNSRNNSGKGEKYNKDELQMKLKQ